MITFTRLIFIGLCVFNALSSNAADAYVVSYVYDGDTVKLHSMEGGLNRNKDFKLRLINIDAPERNQAYGLDSRRALIKLCQGNNIVVTAQITGSDKYNRSLGKLKCNHIDASSYLVEHGLAWHYAQYSSDLTIYNASLKARQQRLGLWADNSTIPPWVWRKKHAYKKQSHH